MMLFPTAGLTDDMVKTAIFKLEIVYENPLLAKIFSSIIESLESSLSMVLKEMFSIRADIIYWENLNKSNSWEIQLLQWNSRIYNTFLLRSVKSHMMVDPKNIHNNLLNIIDILQQKFSLLLIVLAKLHEITGSYLKEIVLLLNRPLITPTHTSAQQRIVMPTDDAFAVENIPSIVYTKLQLSIQSLVMIIQEHISPLDKPLQEILKENAYHHSHHSSLEGNEGDNLAHIPEGVNESRSLDSKDVDTYFTEHDSLYNYCIQIQYYIEDYQYEHENEVSFLFFKHYFFSFFILYYT